MIVRNAELADAPDMAVLLNEIIRIGGTTAYEDAVSAEDLRDWYLTGPAAICAHVAEEAGVLLGFQVLGRNPDLPADWGDIGTFVKAGLQRGGIGAALFVATAAAARARGVTTINATIRADNAPGLGYYSRRGFQNYDHDHSFTLKDGRVVGRVSKRFNLLKAAY
jgi:L-amino acid N-acyltransferase YncA